MQWISSSCADASSFVESDSLEWWKEPSRQWSPVSLDVCTALQSQCEEVGLTDREEPPSDEVGITSLAEDFVLLFVDVDTDHHCRLAGHERAYQDWRTILAVLLAPVYNSRYAVLSSSR